MEDNFNDLSGMFPDAEKPAGQLRSPLERVRGHAETALHLTKSARTFGDVPRYLQRVIDGINVELAINPGAQSDREAMVEHMAQRFLGWKLPQDFHPDAGISFEPEFNKEWNAKQGKPPQRHEPVGTNLFSADQARAMVHYLVNGLPEAASE